MLTMVTLLLGPTNHCMLECLVGETRQLTLCCQLIGTAGELPTAPPANQIRFVEDMDDSELAQAVSFKYPLSGSS